MRYAVDLAVSLKKIGSKINILIIGNGAEENIIREYALEKGVIDQNFYMHSRLNKSYMPAIYDKASMVMSLFMDLKEMQDNSANKFFDGLAAGKPIFLNYGGWMAELINSYECGYVGYRTDMETVARDLDGILNDDELINNMGRNSLTLGQEQFNRDNLVQELINVIEAVYCKNGSAARGN